MSVRDGQPPGEAERYQVVPSGTKAAERCPFCGTDAGENYFDRSLCPPPCNSMHTRCNACGTAYGECPLEDADGSLVAAPESGRAHADVIREALEEMMPSDMHVGQELADGALAALDALVSELAAAEQALSNIEQVALRQHIDWMHFHELAMAEPFKAESEAQAFAQRIQALALAAVGGAHQPRGDEQADGA